ncbi:MAG: hypothetical protein ACKOXN_08275 [Limnohabitans sp.]
MKKNTKLYLIVCPIAIVITSIVVTYEGVNHEQEILQPSLPNTNIKESATVIDEKVPLGGDPFKSFLDNKSTQKIVNAPKSTSSQVTPEAKDPFREFLENKKKMDAASTVSPFGTSNSQPN